MAHVVLVASGKGGVGKTTLVAGVGTNLARLKKKVLLIDANFGLRNLDIVLGMSDMVSFDLYDVITKKCPSDKAILNHPTIPNLYFLASPQGQDLSELTKASFKKLISEFRDYYDYIFVDGAAGLAGVMLCAPACDEGILVVTPNYLSVRDAEALSFPLEKNGISDLKIVVNMVDPVIMKKNQAYNIDDIIDTIKVPFLGVVPYDRKVQQDTYVNLPFYDDFYVRANEAFRNIAQRLLGDKVKIMKLK